MTYYRWRQEFGGLKIEQVKGLKDLELENSRLRKAVSDLTLDKLILQEAARGTGRWREQHLRSKARPQLCSPTLFDQTNDPYRAIPTQY